MPCRYTAGETHVWVTGCYFTCPLAISAMQDSVGREDILPLSWILDLVLKWSQIFVDLPVVEAGNYPPPSPSGRRQLLMIVAVRCACVSFHDHSPLTLGLPCRASPIPGVPYTLHHTLREASLPGRTRDTRLTDSIMANK